LFISEKNPNIIFLLNDHQAYYGHGEMSGGPKILRPNFDKLGNEGIKFTRAYCASPLCGPARRSILTGLFPHNHGEICNDTNFLYDRDLYLDILGINGYKNYYFGKWHAGRQTAHKHHCDPSSFSYPSYGNPYNKPEYLEYIKKLNLPPISFYVDRLFWDPTEPEGMVEVYGIKEKELYTPSWFWSASHSIGTMKTPKETHEAFFLAHMACEKLEELAESSSEQPFHLRVDFWGPHQPFIATEEYLNMYNPENIPEYPSFKDDLKNKPESAKRELNYRISKDKKIIQPSALPWSEWQKVLQHNYAQQTMVDEAGGLIIDKLDKLGLTENTIIIWSTDHGDSVGCHGGHFDKTFYMPEELIRIPMVIRYPKMIPPNQVSEKLVSNMDIPCTILDAAGLKFNNTVDGESLLPLSAQDPESLKHWRQDLMCETNGHMDKYLARLVVTDRYKYVWNYNDMDELYDLKNDPFEMNNLIVLDEYNDILEDMKNKLKKWRETTYDAVKFSMLEKRAFSHRLNREWKKTRRK
jgi:arylsulfatase A-like enzyme